ncbi:hypothetical protein D3C71_1427890 [compost metagenome]
MRLGLNLGALLFTHEADADLDKITDDLFDVAADITDFGEFCRLDLDERRAGELSETTGDFRLADTGRADHQDVLRHDFIAQALVELVTTPAVTQRNCNGALGIMLADDVAIEFGNDFAGGEIGHVILSAFPLRPANAARSAGPFWEWMIIRRRAFRR